ncbi:MAG TPA: hypothetical protein DFR83_02005, partial [Deltaproteobacteria bacterium]|nr:hypothetical protein [Deltaproteobacteria bacterium]
MSTRTTPSLETTAPSPSSLAFVLHPSSGHTGPGDALDKPSVLEVASIWSDTVADVQHIRPGSRPVTGGSSTGTRWRLLGIPMAWVPRSFGTVAWMMAPMLSEVSEEWKSDFFIPANHLQEDEFALFRFEDGTFVGRFREDWDGFIDCGSDRIRFSTLIEQGRAWPDGAGTFAVEVQEGTRLVAELGDMVLVSRLVPESAGIQARPGANIDPVFTGVLSLGAAVFALLMMVLWTTPPPPESTVAALEERVASLVLHRPVAAPRPASRNAPASKDDAGAKAKGEAGTIGRKNARQKEASGARRPTPKKLLDREVVSQAGVLGVL